MAMVGEGDNDGDEALNEQEFCKCRSHERGAGLLEETVIHKIKRVRES
ncbi:hypothetical protein AMTRI_Chr02g264000 [Amborella trichopoda]